MSKKQDFLFSRRNFLKSSGVLGTSFSLFGLTGCQSSKSKSLIQEKDKKITQTYHVCPRNCYDQCSLVADHMDGRVVKITGDKTNPWTAGTPCVKGHTHINVLYHPDRLLYPMKRAGKKGKGKWERISWDEAYNTIISKMKDSINQYGPESIMPYNFSGTVGFINQHGVPFRFFNKLGATMITRTVCNSGGMEALNYTFGDYSSLDPENYAKTKCYVEWGANESYTDVHAVKFIKQARQNGAKLIVVNPHRHPLASQADMFIQIKPGTDAALALGLQNVIINECLYDKEFVENYTLGFEKLREKVQQFPPNRVAQICGISEDEIIEFAHVYAAIKPSVLRMGFGMQRRTNGGSAIRAISFLPALVGVVGMEAGGYSYVNYNQKPFINDYLKRPDLLANKNVRNINTNEFGKALTGELSTTKEKPIKVLFCFNGNPIPSAPNVNLIRKGLEREDLFTVVFEQFITDTAEYADILLPASHFMEYEEVFSDYLAWYVRYSEKGLKPMGESKPNYLVFNELAKRMGYSDDCFDETPADIIKKGIQNKPEFSSVTYDTLRENHWIKIDLGIPWSDHKFKTPSGKVEFYSELAAKNGFDPIADYVPDKESEDGSPELFVKYPIHLLTPAAPQLLSSQWHNIPYITENLGEPYITLHENDAAFRGIKDGDYANVFNDRGRVRIKVKTTTAAVKPGVAVSFKSYWEKIIKGSTINSLASDTIGDMGGISTFNTNLVQISKA